MTDDNRCTFFHIGSFLSMLSLMLRRARQAVNSLRTKLLAAFLAVALIPLSLLAFLNQQATRAALIEAGFQSLFAAASRTAVSLDSFVSANLNIIGTEAQLPALVDYLSLPAEKRASTPAESQISNILQTYTHRKDRAFISSYALLDLNGRNVMDTQPSALGRIEADQDYFRAALDAALPYVSPVEFSGAGEKASIFFSSPVYNAAGEAAGVLRATYDATVLQDLILQSSRLLGAQSFAVLLDENHFCLACGAGSNEKASGLIYKLLMPIETVHAKQLKDARRLPPQPVSQLVAGLSDLQRGLEKADDPKPFFTTRLSPAGEGIRAAAVTRMKSRPWQVVYFQPQDVLLTSIEVRTIETILLALLIAVLVGALAIGLAGLLADPILHLTATVGRIAEGDLTAQTRVSSGDEIGILGTAFNDMAQKLRQRIEEQKQAEEALGAEKERLAVTLRSIGDGVITTDVEGRIVLINRIAEEMTGWHQREAAGRPVHDIFHIVNEKTRARCENPVNKVLETGGIAGLANHTVLIAKNGMERIIADSGAPIRDRESKVIGVVLVFRDITEKRKIEEELAKAEKLESIGILAGGIAHDFNNILTAVTLNVSLAKIHAGASPDKTCVRLEQAEKACERARDLTQQLLTFSKGGAPIKKTTSIGEIIQDSAIFSLRGSNVKCRFSIPADTWPVRVDEGQISQVINNLIINGVQAMPEGGIIEVSTENLRIGSSIESPLAPGKYVKISVRDQGTGIPEEHLPKIFDPYFTTKEKGSGLGLATSYSIVKRHGGHIGVECREGHGSTFHVYLPASTESSSQAEVRQGIPIAGRGRILVMEDDDIIRATLVEMLLHLGYEAECAKDGTEAIEAYLKAKQSKHQFGVVIMDLTIPGAMGGKECIKKLLEIDPQVKAIVSSGYSSDPIMSNFGHYGFSGMLGKPYRMDKLSETLSKVMTG